MTLSRRLFSAGGGGDSFAPPLPGVDYFTILAVGETIAYQSPFNATTLARGQATIAAMAAEENVDAILILGDVSNDQGSAANYVVVESSYTAIIDKVHPVPGNHDYLDYVYGTHDTPAYFSTFAGFGESMKGWYSFDLGGWHLIALNSNYDEAGVGVSGASEQGLWLANDLAANAGKHILAYWHQPVVTSTAYSDDTFWKSAGSFWDQLYDAGAEIILNGHAHLYERYSRMDADGAQDDAGPRQFIAGTASSNHSITNTPTYMETRASVIGYLKLTLMADSYSWDYRTVIGTYTDTGSCDVHP
ncbi:MAG TPA: metallophosphoesterase [Actinomycetes bacterium]|nr:metallophosphoesterase [Actinomycetes bacterium]